MAATKTVRKPRTAKVAVPVIEAPASAAMEILVGEQFVKDFDAAAVLAGTGVAIDTASRVPSGKPAKKAKAAKVAKIKETRVSKSVRCEHRYTKDDRQCGANTTDPSVRCSNHRPAVAVEVPAV